MKNPKFFVQLDGSIRNIPNAIGVIDSTVSTKQHILYKLFTSYIKKESKTTFFHYRFSKYGNSGDYWNPNMTQVQLNDYKSKFPMGEFERYFLNTWGSASQKVFTPEIIMSMSYIGCDSIVGNGHELMKVCADVAKAEDHILYLTDIGKLGDNPTVNATSSTRSLEIIRELKKRLMPIEAHYKLRDASGFPTMATLTELERLSVLLDTKWAVCVGVDRADPMKITNRGAKTVIVVTAKGLPGSGSRPFLPDSGHVPAYLYVVLHVVSVESHSLEDIKDVLVEVRNEFDGIDSLCGERWGLWDLAPWCEQESIPLEAIHPSYDKQRECFTELYLAASSARLKCPEVGVWGSKSTDIVREELGIFFHDPDKRWFGSPEKGEVGGIQDDCVFSLAYSIFGGRSLSTDDFKERRGNFFFGTLVLNKDCLGMY
jgi:hypothetical protein